MKFLRVMLAAALCAAALAGCGSSEKGGSAYTTDDVNKIAEAGAFSEELETVDADTAFALYGLADAGLTREQLTDCAVLRFCGCVQLRVSGEYPGVCMLAEIWPEKK